MRFDNGLVRWLQINLNFLPEVLSRVQDGLMSAAKI